MPCATVHLLTAGRTLDAWRRHPVNAPFDPEIGSLAHDFLVGAMAPDLGFVPAADRTISELVHYIESGNLIRALLARARTAGETAFAWGWATHHLTDVLIHPLVGKAVGEVLHGDRERRVNASANEEVHVSVEVGLDIVIQGSAHGIPAPARHDGLMNGTFDFVEAALARTYGLRFDKDRVAGDLRLAARQLRYWPGLIRWLGRIHRVNQPGQATGLGASTLRSLALLGPGESAMRGLCAPQRPPEWLPVEVQAIANDFPEHFQPLVASAGAALENRNLETGLLETESQEHPSAKERRAWWTVQREACWRPWTVLPLGQDDPT
ncbi:MAG: zinc dependent phospholipase C family protein [Longimicrobiales bacterium]